MIDAPLVTMAAYGSSGIMGEALSESGVSSVSPVWVYCLPACRTRASLALMTPLSDLSFTYYSEREITCQSVYGYLHAGLLIVL